MAAKSTYELTADKQIKIGHGALCNLLVITDGTNDARVILYDVADSGDAAVTNKLCEITVLGASHYGGRTWFEPVMFTNGLWADVNGTDASFIVEWRN
jgi:hypothetical protein